MMGQEQNQVGAKTSETASTGYELIDFGAGRKLERFGSVILDRVSPAADGIQPSRSHWKSTAHLDARGRVENDAGLPDEWRIVFAGLQFILKLTPFGHVGLFPEQASNWEWISAWCQSRAAEGTQPKVLNLFAYTGASTLAAAKAGAHVTHVDASKPAVSWARRNAELNQLADAPVRWIVEDAQKYLGREVRRGNRYDLIILDPPSYGHGPQGKRWELKTNAMDLVSLCQELLEPHSDSGSPSNSQLLLTAHSAEPDGNELRALAQRVFKSPMRLRRMLLNDESGRGLDAGFCIQIDC